MGLYEDTVWFQTLCKPRAVRPAERLRTLTFGILGKEPRIKVIKVRKGSQKGIKDVNLWTECVAVEYYLHHIF